MDEQESGAAPEEPQQAPSEAARRSAWQPWVTYVLIGINVVLFLITAQQSHTLGDQNSDVLLRWGAGYPVLMWLGQQYWRLFAQMWLHGSLVHIAMNAYSLYVLGRVTEALFGRVRFLYIYLVGGLVGSLASLWMAAPDQLSVGASGAVVAVFGALIFLKVADPVRGQLLQWRIIAINLILMLGVGLGFANVDNWAHLGGLAGGFVAAAVVGLLPRPRWDGTPVRPAAWRGVLGAAVLAGMLTLLTGLVDIPGRNGAPYISTRLGFDALDQGNLSQATREFAAALAVSPDLGEPHYGLAVVAYDQQNWHDAANHVAAALRYDNQDPRYLELQAKVQQKLAH